MSQLERYDSWEHPETLEGRVRKVYLINNMKHLLLISVYPLNACLNVETFMDSSTTLSYRDFFWPDIMQEIHLDA